MKNLIDDIKEFQNIILSDDKLYYYKYGNKELPKSQKEENSKVKKEEKKKEETIKKSYMDIYKPLFDSLALRQNKLSKNEEMDNNNSQNKYKKYIINYKDEKPTKNNFNLEEEFNMSSNAFKRTQSTTNYNKKDSKYKTYSSDKDKNKLIDNFKKKYFRNKDEEEYLYLLRQKNLGLQLDTMHKSISERIENDSRFQPFGYKKIINSMLKEIDIIRKERKRENNIFERKIKSLQNELLYDNKNSVQNKIKTLKNIYNKKKNIKNKNSSSNKRALSNKHKTNGYKKEFKKNNFNDYLNKYKSMPKNRGKKYNNNRITKKIHKDNTNLEQLYKQNLINEINQLNKENELIERKYKNLPISNQRLIDIINIKSNIKPKNNSKFIDYKKNSTIIKKNINIISKDIINELLYECIEELMYIENQKSEEKQKERFKRDLNITRINLEDYIQREKELILKYKNEKNNIENYQVKNINQYPSKIKTQIDISNDLIEKCNINQEKFLEYMILKGSFYSDYNIFKIYDIFIDEMSKIIMEQEIDDFLKKADFIVDNICKDEIKDILQ